MNQWRSHSRIKALSVAIAGVMVLEGCSSLPDMQLAKRAKAVGDYHTAFKHYSALADTGYIDATIYLGDTYMLQSGPEAIGLAEARYREAAKSSAKAKLRLAKLLAKKSNASELELIEAESLLRRAYEQGDNSVLPLMIRVDMALQNLWPGEEKLSINNDVQQRELPKANHALNATSHLVELAKLCEQMISHLHSCYPELTKTYLTVNDNNSLTSLFQKSKTEYQLAKLEPSILFRMASILIKKNTSKTRTELAEETFKIIENEYPQALIARIRLRIDDPHFSSTEEIFLLLEKASSLQLPEADFLTGKIYFDGKLVPLEPRIAEENLLRVSGRFPAADYWVGQLYLRGYLGRPDFQKAQKHLLLAARAGSKKADYTLAQMYSGGKGVKPNRIYAFVFSRLAVEAELSSATDLTTSIESIITQEEWTASDKLLAEEKQLRSRKTNKEIAITTPAPSDKNLEMESVSFPSHEWGAIANFAYRRDDEQDLGQQPGRETDEFQINIKPWMRTELSQDWCFFTQLQAFYASDETDIDSDEGGGSSDGFLGVKELWFDYSGISKYPGESFRLGLQRLKEEDGLWWDKDIESARWIFDTTTLFAFAGVSQNFYNYRTDDNQLSKSDENQLNLYATASWQWQPGHHIGSRILYKRHDSDKPLPGTRVTQENANELARGNFYWLGLNSQSDYFNYRNDEALSYYAELTWLHFKGDDALLTTNNGISTVNEYQSENSDNFSLDLGARWKLPVEPRMHLGVAMAMGTGGREGDTPNSFVQSGLHSNRSRFTGTRARFHRFNEAYQADLTNLRVATLYGTLAKPRQFDLSLVYHYFQRNDGDESIIANGINAPLVNNSKELGHGLDFVATYYFREITSLLNWQFDHDAYARLRASAFKPGDAYGSDADDLNYRVTLDVSFQF